MSPEGEEQKGTIPAHSSPPNPRSSEQSSHSPKISLDTTPPISPSPSSRHPQHPQHPLCYDGSPSAEQGLPQAVQLEDPKQPENGLVGNVTPVITRRSFLSQPLPAVSSELSGQTMDGKSESGYGCDPNHDHTDNSISSNNLSGVERESSSILASNHMFGIERAFSQSAQKRHLHNDRLIGEDEEDEEERIETERQYRIHYDLDSSPMKEQGIEYEPDDDYYKNANFEEFERNMQLKKEGEKDGNSTPERADLSGDDQVSEMDDFGKSTFIQPTMEEMMRGVEFSDEDKVNNDDIEMCDDSLV